MIVAPHEALPPPSALSVDYHEVNVGALRAYGGRSQHEHNISTVLGDSNFKQVQYTRREKVYGGLGAGMLTVFVFFYMLLFREQMFNESISTIISMQSHRNFVLDFSMNFISMCVNPNLVISLLVIVFALSTQKLKILTFLLYYGMLVYLCTTMKSIFSDPRPFWVDAAGMEVSTTVMPTPSTASLTSIKQAPSISGQMKTITNEQLLHSLINLFNTQPETLRESFPIISDLDQIAPVSSILPEADEVTQASSESLDLKILPETINKSQPTVIPLDWKCYSEYGNPSGHSFLGVPLYEFILRDYILRKIPEDSRLLRIISVLSSILLVNLILISRMYLGMHSSNQVIFGVALGLSSTILYRLFAEKRISQTLYRFATRSRGEAKQEILAVSLSTILAFTMPICLYAIQNSQFEKQTTNDLQDQWASTIKLKCNKFDEYNSFHHKCFIDASVVSICFSIVLGFILTSRDRFIKGQYKDTPGAKNFFIRTALVLACCIFAALAYGVLPFHQLPYLRYTSMFIGVFITGYLLVALVPILFEKYSLISLNSSNYLQKDSLSTSLDSVDTLHSPLSNSDL